MQHYRQRRMLTDRSVLVRTEDDVFRATVSNITEAGMRLKGDLTLERDEMIEIEGGSWTAEAQVVWRKDGFVGVKLLKKLTASELAHVTGRRMRLNRQSRVGFGHTHL